jgi:cyclopropane-fatty-acyl-phospholipid synthase
MSAVDAIYAGTSRETIQEIYDVGNDFWRLWLDPRMAYSSAMWEQGDTLESAQLRKIDYLIGEARASGARRVIDVGCGWGGALRRMVEAHGVEQVVGLTMSNAQAEWIEAWGDPRIEVRVENWQSHVPEEPYDAMVSAGAFEHFARQRSSAQDKLLAYRAFFKWAHEVLAPDRWLALQTSTKGNARLTPEAIAHARFIWERIFPDSEVPWLAEIDESSRKRFDIRRVRNDPDDYAKTAAAWLENLTEHRAQALATSNDETVLAYERYLLAVVHQFEHRHLGLMRLTLQRM